MMSFLSRVRLVALFLLVAVVCLLGGFELGKKNTSSSLLSGGKVVEKTDMSLFWRVWQQLEENYLDKTVLDPKKMLYGAISGMTSALDDPYTSFFPPSENTRSKEDLNGEFAGVGIQLGFVNKTLAVVAPLPGNPAIKAGIRAGDLILKIKDEEKGVDKDTAGIDLNQAVDLIRGKNGNPVTLTIYREGDSKPKEYTLIRETINVPSVELEWVGQAKNVALLRVNRFGDKTLAEWNGFVSEVINKKAVGVVLDLRNNPGGYLQRAVDLGSEFIADGVIVQQQGKNSTETFSATGKGRLIGKPLVVLINRGSASASEILAGALKERVGAKLVGEKSFGKGTVQEVEDFPGGSGIHITIAKWLLPSGKNIHKEGIEPDVKVDYVVNDKDSKADNQLSKAIEVLLSK